MKKIILLILLLQPFLYTDAQSNVSGRFSLSTGFDYGAHLLYHETKYQGNTVDRDTSGAVTSQFQFNAHYAFAKWFSAGLGFKRGRYIEDPDNAENEYEENNVGHFYLDTRFYLLNKEKFNLYAGLGFGRSSLHIDYTANYTFFSFNAKQDYSAPYTRLNLGFNWYIGNKIGLWFNTEFNKHDFKLNYYELNGAKQDLTDYDITLDTRGIQLAIGVCIKFK